MLGGGLSGVLVIAPYLIFLAIVVGAVASPVAADLAGHPSIIDGDTIEFHGTRIRLYGIDAPESRQLCKDALRNDYRCGQKAAFALADHIGGGTISCNPRDTDRYGRTVAICYLRGEDLGAWMVALGLAVAYRHYSGDYVTQEEAADAAKVGLWVGSFLMP
jgi:endonuclease YncB( thermonuclease family)